MTKENESVPGLKERVQRNERVIDKLERRLYSCSQQALAIASAGEGKDINPRTKYRIRDLQQQIMDATDRNTALHRVLSGEDDGKPIPLEKMKKIEPGPSPAGDARGARNTCAATPFSSAARRECVERAAVPCDLMF